MAMGFRDEYYPQTVALMIQRYGESAPDSSGNRLPITTPIQTLGVLGSLAPHVIRILESFQSRQGVSAEVRGALPERFVDGSGFADYTAGQLGEVITSLLPWKDYVAGIPKPGYPPARTTLARTGQYFVPWLPSGFVGSWQETDLQTFLRQMMFDWQAAVDASAEGIRSQANTNDPMTPINNATFWAAIRRLTSTMDVIDENPPRDFFDRVKGAVSTALDQSAQFAGEAAAGLSQKAGEIAGNFGKGFFAEAGILSLVVAGIAVYIFVA